MKRIVLILAVLAVACTDSTWIAPEPPPACSGCFGCIDRYDRISLTDSTDALILRVCDGGIVKYRVGADCRTPPDTIIIATMIYGGQPSGYSAQVPSDKAVMVTVERTGAERSFLCIGK